METHAPEARNATVTASVRDRIVAFHDRHLRVAPVAGHLRETFQAVTEGLESRKAREIADRLRPRIDRWCKNAEVALSVGDLVLGVVATGVGAREYAKVRKTERAIATNTQDLGIATDVLRAFAAKEMGLNKRWAQSVGLTGAGLGFLALRPLSRLTDIGTRVARPLQIRVVRAVDRMLLRREEAGRRVYVGSSTP